MGPEIAEPPLVAWVDLEIWERHQLGRDGAITGHAAQRRLKEIRGILGSLLVDGDGGVDHRGASLISFFCRVQGALVVALVEIQPGRVGALPWGVAMVELVIHDGQSPEALHTAIARGHAMRCSRGLVAIPLDLIEPDGGDQLGRDEMLVVEVVPCRIVTRFLGEEHAALIEIDELDLGDNFR
jgi:hypothetical protein